MKGRSKRITSIGLDISLGHGAVVCLVNGELDRFWYYTEQAGRAKASKRGSRLPHSKGKGADRETVDIARLSWISRWLVKVIGKAAPSCAAIEAYALAASRGAHQVGEAGGAAKLALWNAGVPFRTHDPSTVKMFSVHDGSADKRLVEDAVRDRWGEDYSECNGKVKGRTTSEDLCDARVLAAMAWIEYQLRAGMLTLGRLEHDKERRVFLKTTKASPVNVLGREWIQ